MIRTERWVGFPKAAGVVERLQTLLGYPKRPRMPCLLIYGRSGMGKSMAIAKFGREHPAVFAKQEGSTAMPVVAFQMPKEPLEGAVVSPGAWQTRSFPAFDAHAQRARHAHSDR